MHQLNIALVRELPPFDGMAPDAIQDLLDRGTSQRCEERTTIFRESEPAHSFFLLLDGHIQVVKINADGEQMIARYISSGELYGIAKAIGRDTYPANAIAAVDCVSLIWPMSIWDQVITTHPTFATNSYATVGKRLGETQDQVMALATNKVEQRVANALLRLANQTGKKTEEGILIDFPITRQDISEMTGTTLHTVSRLMSKWEEMGWVLSGRKKVVLVEGHKLVMVGNGNN